MINSGSPCYGCTERVLGCKANCSKEAAWQAKRAAEKELIFKNKNVDTDYWRFKRKGR